jgi:hypothetical protein
VQVASAENRVRQRILAAFRLKGAIGETAVYRVPRLVGIYLQRVVVPEFLYVLEELIYRVAVALIVGCQQQALLL